MEGFRQQVEAAYDGLVKQIAGVEQELEQLLAQCPEVERDTGEDRETAHALAEIDRKIEHLMSALAGLGVAVEGGSPAALAAADRTCPSAAREGVADLCRELWPAAFAGAE